MNDILNPINLVRETYNTIINNESDDPLGLLTKSICKLKEANAHGTQIAFLYCLQSDYFFDERQYDDAYKHALEAQRLDSERKEVLHCLINLYLPNNNENDSILNPYEDDEKAKECATRLESLHPNDPESLYDASKAYSSLGLFCDALRCLKIAYSKVSSNIKKCKSYDQNLNGFKTSMNEITAAITETYFERYSMCPNDAHSTIIHYLIELIQWKYNGFSGKQLEDTIQEIWQRIEFLLDTKDDDIALDWDSKWKLIESVPCCVPFSCKLLNLFFKLLLQNQESEWGIQFFTRLITEYQTYNDNMMILHAKFDNFEVLHLNRSKLYSRLNKKHEMHQDMNLVNSIRYSRSVPLIAEKDLNSFVVTKENETPVIVTPQQVKSRRASIRNDFKISPMSQKYRDFHYSPAGSRKSCKPRSKSMTHCEDKKDEEISMICMEELNAVDASREDICRDDMKTESVSFKDEYHRVRQQNQLLSAQVSDLKKDLLTEFKESSNSTEIMQLQKSITTVSNEMQMRETAGYGGEKDVQESDQEMVKLRARLMDYIGQFDRLTNQMKKRDQMISSLKMEGQDKTKQISDLTRQLKILKDCAKKNTAETHQKTDKIKKQKSPSQVSQEKPEASEPESTLNFVKKLMTWVVELAVLCGLVIFFMDKFSDYNFLNNE